MSVSIEIEFVPVTGDGLDKGVEIRCLAVNINQYHSGKELTAYFFQPMQCRVEVVVAVHAFTVNVRRGFQFARSAVAPAMVTAGDQAFDGSGLFDQLHPAVRTDVVKNLDLLVLIANDQQRESENVDGMNPAVAE